MADLVIVTTAELAVWLGAAALNGACVGAIVVLLALRKRDQAAARVEPRRVEPRFYDEGQDGEDYPAGVLDLDPRLDEDRAPLRVRPWDPERTP